MIGTHESSEVSNLFGFTSESSIIIAKAYCYVKIKTIRRVVKLLFSVAELCPLFSFCWFRMLFVYEKKLVINQAIAKN